MAQMRFNRELYSKAALIKAAYNYTDLAYLHIDADEKYYYVTLEAKPGITEINEQEFQNEMLAQSVRHEVYRQTKNIRELMLARAVATSLVVTEQENEETEITTGSNFTEDEILKDWFEENETTGD